MAQGNKGAKLTPEMVKRKWKKGQSGNPGGKVPEPPELKKLKHLTKLELVEIGNLIIKGDRNELEKKAKDKGSTVIQSMMAAIAKRVIDDGDMVALDRLLDRLIGKVKDEVEFSGNVLNAPQVIVTLPSNGREKKGA